MENLSGDFLLVLKSIVSQYVFVLVLVYSLQELIEILFNVDASAPSSSG